MKQSSVQIQSVLYHNEIEALVQALDNLANAIKVDRKNEKSLGAVKLCYGDASKEPLFTQEEINRLQETYAPYFELNYTFFHENTGTAKGHNRMGAGCTSEYMMIMNPDIMVNPHFFAQMLLPFERQEKTGMTEARQTPIEHHKEYDPETGETSWASTAAAIFPTEYFREINGFDEETFFMYCDDLDFSWRIRLAGYKVIYVPQAVIFHAKHIGEKAEWLPTRAERYYSVEAALLMAHKWSNPKLEKELLQIYMASEDEMHQEAAKAYVKRCEEGRLPKPIDPEHKAADFVGYGYGKSRFQM